MTNGGGPHGPVKKGKKPAKAKGKEAAPGSGKKVMTAGLKKK
jgi:hypothetical protein